ncbi:MAG: DUF1080 domain-containing protein [bacterium]|nr:DUF1080 domain-containing protein [bacterium]
MRCFCLLVVSLVSAACAVGPPGFEPIFVPGSFAGWHTAPGGTWEWRGHVLVGKSPESERRHGILLTDARYRDFELRVEFRVLSGDSGLYFRVDESGSHVAVNGFQAEVDRTLDTGGLYETGGRAWVVKPDHDRMRELYVPGEWTRMRIRAVGRDIDVFVNDEHTAALRDDPGRLEGHIGLQLHGGQDMHVEFRDLAVRRLGASVSAVAAGVAMDAEPELTTRCAREIVELHQFFEDWFAGRIPANDETFARFADVLHPEFHIVGTSGKVLDRAAILEFVRRGHGRSAGAATPSVIEVRNVQWRSSLDGGHVLTYEEWQGQGHADSGRTSTVLFRRDPAAPNGLRWLHVHETRLGSK